MQPSPKMPSNAKFILNSYKKRSRKLKLAARPHRLQTTPRAQPGPDQSSDRSSAQSSDRSSAQSPDRSPAQSPDQSPDRKFVEASQPCEVSFFSINNAIAPPEGKALESKLQTVRSMPDSCRQHMEDLMHDGILVPCPNPRAVSGYAFLPDGDGLRLAINYSNLAIHCVSNPVMTVTELLHRARPFVARIDLRDAYYQWELCRCSARFATILTHKGLYMFTRMPQQLKSSFTFVEHKLHHVLRDIEHTVRRDKVQVWGDSMEQCQGRYDAALRALAEAKLEVGKCSPPAQADVVDHVMDVVRDWDPDEDVSARVCAWAVMHGRAFLSPPTFRKRTLPVFSFEYERMRLSSGVKFSID